jgi:hypothetical protein
LILVTTAIPGNQVFVASATLSFVSGLVLAALSHLEHAKTIRPSFLINSYLIVTVILDVARVRTQWLVRENDAISSVLATSLGSKCIMLVLEAFEKRSLLLGLDRHFSLESTSGLISRGSFWWLNGLLMRGSKKILTMDDLPAIHEKLDSEHLAQRLQVAWDKCKEVQNPDAPAQPL